MTRLPQGRLVLEVSESEVGERFVWATWVGDLYGRLVWAILVSDLYGRLWWAIYMGDLGERKFGTKALCLPNEKDQSLTMPIFQRIQQRLSRGGRGQKRGWSPWAIETAIRMDGTGYSFDGDFGSESRQVYLEVQEFR